MIYINSRYIWEGRTKSDNGGEKGSKRKGERGRERVRM